MRLESWEIFSNIMNTTIFQNIISTYKSYPYQGDLYCLYDTEQNGYVYIISSDCYRQKEYNLSEALFPFFYERKFAQMCANFKDSVKIKPLAYASLNIFAMWCKSTNVSPVFFTMIDRRESGQTNIYKRPAGSTNEFVHFLFSKDAIKEG